MEVEEECEPLECEPLECEPLECEPLECEEEWLEEELDPPECDPPPCPRAKLSEGARAKASAASTAVILIMGSPDREATLARCVRMGTATGEGQPSCGSASSSLHRL